MALSAQRAPSSCTRWVRERRRAAQSQPLHAPLLILHTSRVAAEWRVLRTHAHYRTSAAHHTLVCVNSCLVYLVWDRRVESNNRIALGCRLRSISAFSILDSLGVNPLPSGAVAPVRRYGKNIAGAAWACRVGGSETIAFTYCTVKLYSSSAVAVVYPVACRQPNDATEHGFTRRFMHPELAV